MKKRTLPTHRLALSILLFLKGNYQRYLKNKYNGDNRIIKITTTKLRRELKLSFLGSALGDAFIVLEDWGYIKVLERRQRRNRLGTVYIIMLTDKFFKGELPKLPTK